MSIQSYVYEDALATSAACASKLMELIRNRLAIAPHASVAVSGGSTPKLMFEELAKAHFDWSRVHLFWVDERGVPPTDSQSNYRLTKEHFIDPAGFPAANVHRVLAELEPAVAARKYVDEIRKFFALKDGEQPHFDIVHRGMGPDAHTASLFPGEPLIDDQKNIAAAVYVEKFQQWRITLLPGALMAARYTLMLLAGSDKADPLHAALTDPYNPKKYPVQIATRDQPNVMWYLDKAAARLLG